jgi:thioredoxin reductase
MPDECLDDRSGRVCVVGAGSSGLAAAKNLLEAGFDIDVIERDADLGGNWNYGRPGSRVYRSTRMISSKSFTQYSDFTMPDHFPDYPHHEQVIAYLRAYSRHFGIDRRTEYETSVESIVPASDHRSGRASDDRPSDWDVTTHRGRRRYRAVVIANGHNHKPRWPKYPGHFDGESMHSAQYKTPDVLTGKRVLVVGGGNSACDIAVEAAQQGCATLHSTRRGYHYVPKYLFGRPSDLLSDRLAALGLPLALRRRLIAALLRVVGGSSRKSPLPRPDHRLYETHPVVNSLLPYYVRHAAIRPKPEIAELAGREVRFVDGSREAVDLIVYATGYCIDFPFIDRRYLNWRDGCPRLFLNVFHPEFENLFVAGLIQPDSGQFQLVDWQMKAVATFLSAVEQGLPAADKLRLLKRQGAESASKSIHYKRTDRHLLEVEHWGYLHALKCVVRMLGHQRPERKAADEPAVIPISARTRAEVSRDVPARRAA